jgi:basic membrane protein A
MENSLERNSVNKFGVVRLSTVIVISIILIIAILAGIRAMSAQASTIKVGVITNTDTLAGKSVSWISYQGLLHAEQQLGVIGTVYTSTDQSDFEPNVMQCAMDDNDLCIGIGISLADAISKTAAISTTTKFALVDWNYKNYLPNLRGLMFASEDVGYLAGTLAAMMSQSDIIGDLGGMEVPVVTAFTEGYSNGAQCANPDVTTIISYTGDFANPDLGAQYAQGMITQGADVVFAAAGLTGNGAILTTTQSGVWAIGVDTDQYLTLFISGTVPGSNHLLTSAMKRYDNVVFDTISDVVAGTFTSGTIYYDLAVEGVGLAPFHEADASIPSSVRTQLDWVKRAIIGGSIDPLDPNGPCLVMHKQLLPLTLR